MCCPGCQAVASAILAGGFDAYYRFRTEAAVRPEESLASTDEWLVYDDPLVQQGFVTRRPDGMASAQVQIEDIHCAACCWLIEQALVRQPGVLSVSVNLATRRARIDWDPASARLSAIFRKMQEIGYRTQPANAAHSLQAEEERRRELLRLGIAGIAMMQAMMFALALYSGDFSGMDEGHRQFMRMFSLLVSLPVMGYSALPFYRGAWRSLKQRTVGMDVPVSLALWIAFVASVFAVARSEGDVYFDSIAMFVFLLLLSRYAEASARRHFLRHHDVQWQPVTVHRLRTGQTEGGCDETLLSNIHKDDCLLVKAGETIPLDAVVVEGSSSINEASLTGESYPQPKQAGDLVYAGTVNGDGVLVIRVTQVAGNTRRDLVQRLAEAGLAGKAPVQALADRLAVIFTVLVLLLAAGAGWYWYNEDPARALVVVLSVLVVSCPCALSLATPSAIAIGTLALRSKGILLAKPGVTEALARVTCVFFDKTGTLTRGTFSITRTQLLGECPAREVNEIAAALERFSEHPLASAFSGVATDMKVDEPHIEPGAGIEGRINGVRYRIGSREYCQKGCRAPLVPDISASIYLASDTQWLAAYTVEDVLRDGVASTVVALKQQGYETGLLSGDASGAAEVLAGQLTISWCRAGCSPEEKLKQIQLLQAAGERIMMVGDGINDLPVLAQADVSVAMQGASDLARTQADVILLRDDVSALLLLLEHTAKTRRIIRENLAWALLYNGLALPFAAAGLVAPWLAALGMSLSSLLVTMNSLRLRRLA